MLQRPASNSAIWHPTPGQKFNLPNERFRPGRRRPVSELWGGSANPDPEPFDKLSKFISLEGLRASIGVAELVRTCRGEVTEGRGQIIECRMSRFFITLGRKMAFTLLGAAGRFG